MIDCDVHLLWIVLRDVVIAVLLSMSQNFGYPLTRRLFEQRPVNLTVRRNFLDGFLQLVEESFVSAEQATRIFFFTQKKTF